MSRASFWVILYDIQMTNFKSAGPGPITPIGLKRDEMDILNEAAKHVGFGEVV